MAQGPFIPTIPTKDYKPRLEMFSFPNTVFDIPVLRWRLLS